jgi:hypothetical protein
LQVVDFNEFLGAGRHRTYVKFLLVDRLSTPLLDDCAQLLWMDACGRPGIHGWARRGLR